MSIKKRIQKLENQSTRTHQAMPEGLSPMEQYLFMVNNPSVRKTLKTDTTKPSRTYTAEEAYAALIGKDPELS